MKRIALISLHTPTPTNHRGASALPYHLLLFRPKDIEVSVWSFNINDCAAKQISSSEKCLGIKIHLIKKPRGFNYLALSLVRLLLPKPMFGYLALPSSTVEDIRSYLDDVPDSALWIYGEDISHFADKFRPITTVITTPDCEAMYYYRVLNMRNTPLRLMSLARYGLMYHRYAIFASNYPTGPNITYHLVGKQDEAFLRNLNPKAKTSFIRHPHYDIAERKKATVNSDGKIRLLIAGRYDFYMAQAVDDAVKAMCKLEVEMKNRYHVTFLGKGWENTCAILRNAGFDVEQKGFVDDYVAEISTHHIQLTPIAVGTGTKGKVLDAFANGLMVIGTPLALENIASQSGKECVEYSDGRDLAYWLTRLAQNPSLINEIASAGNRVVLSEHGRDKVASQFFELFN